MSRPESKRNINKVTESRLYRTYSGKHFKMRLLPAFWPSPARDAPRKPNVTLEKLKRILPGPGQKGQDAYLVVAEGSTNHTPQ